MAAITMLIVGQDIRYIEKLSLTFLEGLKDEVDLEVITDMDYFKEYAAVPRKIDVLIINENFISDDIMKQNIKLTVLLRTQEHFLEKENTFSIYKFTPLQEIYYKILGKINNIFTWYDDNRNEVETSLVMVYSPIGGSGKTTVAMALSAVLSELGKKVLYLNTETIQNFQSFLDCKDCIANGFERKIAMHDENLMSNFRGAVGTEGFDYVKPMRYSTVSYGIKPENYLYFIDRLTGMNFYEYIILEVPTAFDEYTSTLMEKSSAVITVLNQDSQAVYKAEKFLENIDYTDSNKFKFVCNKYKYKDDNHILKSNILSKCTVTEYVDYDSMLEQVGNLYNIKKNNILKSTAYLMI